jgi:hypothetical protein
MAVADDPQAYDRLLDLLADLIVEDLAAEDAAARRDLPAIEPRPIVHAEYQCGA